jgi:sodium-independent sulfate anion transporter 11
MWAFCISFVPDVSWFIRDVIAGVTVGIIVIPQGMSYALASRISLQAFLPLTITFQLANLTVEYGLYTSFVGVLIYCVREQFIHAFR